MRAALAAEQRAAHAAAQAAAQGAALAATHSAAQRACFRCHSGTYIDVLSTVKVIQQYLECRVAQGTALIYYKLFVRRCRVVDRTDI
jgi:hypothetical protein